MPCFDPRDDEDRRTIRTRLDAATRAGCNMSKVFEAYPELLFHLPAETIEWILEHKKLDKERGEVK
jgi:hypothetical protein